MSESFLRTLPALPKPVLPIQAQPLGHHWAATAIGFFLVCQTCAASTFRETVRVSDILLNPGCQGEEGVWLAPKPAGTSEPQEKAAQPRSPVESSSK